MNTANHISNDDLALFALQFLPEDELKNAIEHMEHCEICREEVARLQGDLVTYAMTAEMASPPALVRERLLRRVARERKTIPMDRDLTPSFDEPVLAARNSLLFPSDAHDEPAPRHHGFGFLTWAGWAVAAAIAVMAGLQFHERQILQSNLDNQAAALRQTAIDAGRAQQALATLTDAGAVQVALHLPAPPGTVIPAKPEGHAAYLADKGALVFVANHLTPLPAYKTYELWLLPANGHDPIAAGGFKPDANGNASVVLPDLPKGVPASNFAVTVEDDTGPKSTPTKPIVLMGL